MAAFLKWLGRLLLSLAAVAACWGAWYVVYRDSQSRMAQEKPESQADPFAVEVVPVRRDEIEERIILVGSLFPIAQTEIRSRVNGYVIGLPFDVGDRVRVNDVICRLEDNDQREEVARADAALNVAKAQLRSQETAQQLAQRNIERQRNLVEGGAGTVQQLEAAEADLKIADASIDLEEARVSEADANLLRARLALEDLTLRSPISGYVAQRPMDVGDLAKPDVPLLRIVNLDTVKTTVNVVEKDYQKIQLGQQAEVTVDAYPREVFHGEVKRIAPVLDVDTRTASVEIEVTNSGQLLKPGMYARVSLRSRRIRKGLLVPVSALLNVDGKPVVYIVTGEASKIERRDVQVGSSDGRVTEVASGLSEGDKVVTLGNRLVKPGQQVAPLEVPWPDKPLVIENQSQGESDPGFAD